MSPRFARAILVAAAAAILAVLPLASAADAAPGKTHTSILIDTAAAKRASDGYVVQARLLSDSGQGVNDVSVSFYVKADLLGEREVFIGAERTDGRGVATLLYVPSWTGRHDVVVRFAGDNTYAGSVATSSFDSAMAVVPHRDEQLGLADFSAKVPYAVGALVVAVWLTIAFALFGTVRSVLVGRAATAPAGAAGHPGERATSTATIGE